METIKQFKVTLKPDTMQSSYLNYKDVALDIDVLKYNDGSIRVTIPNMNESLDHRYVDIDAFVMSVDDIMIIKQIKDVIDRLSKSPKYYSMILSSTTYTRYDRVMYDNKIDGFGAKCFADFINELNLNSVSIIDCHSNVMVDLLHSANDIPQSAIVSSMINLDEYTLIAPDAGALKKLDADIIFDKVRDVTTGNITGMKLAETKRIKTNKFIIVDDICEGGRTFMSCAEIFRNNISTIDALELYVTHGIFSHNAVERLLGHFDHIHTYVMKKSTYDALTDECKKSLTVKYLIDV